MCNAKHAFFFRFELLLSLTRYLTGYQWSISISAFFLVWGYTEGETG